VRFRLRTGGRLLAAVLMGAIAGLGSAHPAGPALASVPNTCGVDIYQVDYGVNTDNGDGVRVQSPGMDVTNRSQSCVFTSSVGVVNSTGNFVETGWYEDPTGELAICDDTANTGKPKLSVTAVLGGNTYGCKHPAPDINNGTYSFSTNDFDRDTVWVFWFSGTNEGSFNLTFSHGQPVDNGERHTLNGSNPNGADFDGLEYGNSGWNNWPSSLVSGDSDTGYKGCNYAGTHTSVISNGSSC
jgi:hypothetical protein